MSPQPQPQHHPQPITSPTRRFTVGFLIGLCVIALLLWVATG